MSCTDLPILLVSSGCPHLCFKKNAIEVSIRASATLICNCTKEGVGILGLRASELAQAVVS